MIDDGVQRRMDDLPEPFGIDLLPRGYEPHDCWQCRYCGRGESLLGITTEAEGIRALAHMRFCPERPAGDIPDQMEVEAFNLLFSDEFFRQISLYDTMIIDGMDELRSTWWPPTRRQIRTRIQRYIKERRFVMADQMILFAGGDPRKKEGK